MGTKTVRLDEDVYERIKSRKREGETFSEAIDRLTGEYTLVDFADEFVDEPAGDRWARDKAIIEAAEDEEDEAVEDLLRRDG